MFKYSLLLIVFSFLNLYCSSAQTESELNRRYQRLFDESRSQMERGQIFEAIQGFEKVLGRYPNHQPSLYLKGYVFFRANQYADAYSAFGRLSELEMLDDLFFDSWYFAGKSLFYQEEFESSIFYFKKYLKSGSKLYKAVSERYIRNAKFAAKAIQSPVDFNPQVVDLPLSVGQSVYLPMKSLDGNLLFYTLREMGRERLVYSKRETEMKYGVSIVPEYLSNYRHTAASSLSPDGNLLLVTICNDPTGLGSCDIYLAFKRGGEWQGPYNIGAPVNTSGWESQPSFGPDGRTFYFSSERMGGYGGRDIWYSRLLDDGTFLEPVNMGPSINTSENEESPFMHPDGVTFFFNSNGHVGLGDYDLFVSKLSGEKDWGKPVNLGYPINTVFHDGALFVDSDGKTAFMASDRLQPPQLRGVYQIFSFELPEEVAARPVTYLRATVRDSETGELLPAAVRLTEWVTGDDLIHRKLGQSGSFFTVMPSGKPYVFNASMEGYYFISSRFEPDENATAYDPFILDIELNRIIEKAEDTISTGIVLENVLFETGSADLQRGSFTELNYLTDFLNKNKNIIIELHGHTDNVGSDEVNQQLSEDRAQSVVNYLVKKGIEMSRMNAIGFGSSYPVADNDTEEGRMKNRRTELHIVKPGNRP